VLRTGVSIVSRNLGHVLLTSRAQNGPEIDPRYRRVDRTHRQSQDEYQEHIWQDLSTTHIAIMRGQEEQTRLPPSAPDQVFVTISALHGGYLTLPESLFITNAQPDKRATVPSLAFLIEHVDRKSTKTERIVFDLGLKREITGYAPAQQRHISQRQPVRLDPDVRASLQAGGLDPGDIDTVMVSQCHNLYLMSCALTIFR
jgi:hypothetical protein